MPRKRHKAEDIVAKLRQVDVLTAQGRPVAEAVRSIGVTEVTYYRWRSEQGGLKGHQVKRLKELEAENNLHATAPLLNPLCADASMASTIRATEILLWDTNRQYHQKPNWPSQSESLSTEYGQAQAPWWGVPANDKWFARLIISDIIAVQLEKLDIAPPKVSTKAIGEMLTLCEQLLKD